MKNSIKIGKIILFNVLTILLVLSTGCSSTMKCSIYGTPNTQIYDSRGTYLGAIPPSGKAEIKLNRKDFRKDFLLTRLNDQAPLMPIGLNYNKRHNGFRNTVTLITTIPTLYMSTWAWVSYMDRHDAEDELKLDKNQTSNSDLYSMVVNAPNPIDEIKAQKQREYKPGKTGERTKHAKSTSGKSKTESNLPPAWLNKTGVFSKLKSWEMVNYITDEVGGHYDTEGTVEFYFGEELDPTCIVNFTVKGKEQEIAFKLLSQFEKVSKNKYEAKTKDHGDLWIEILNQKEISLSYMDGFIIVKFIFEQNSFEEDRISPNLMKRDMVESLLKALSK